MTDPREHPSFKAALAALEEERRGKCEGIVNGSIYSRKGGNRGELCERLAGFHVELRSGGGEGNYCKVHAQRYHRYNERHLATGRILGQAREPFYKISEIIPAEASDPA